VSDAPGAAAGGAAPAGPAGLAVLYEDNHLIAVNKAWGEIVQGDRTGDPTLAGRVAAYLRERYAKPGQAFVGVIHRLDRPTSGVVLFARTGKALARMNAAFRERGVRKVYWAAVSEPPLQPRGTLVHYLVRNAEKNKSFAYDHPREGALKASLSYRLIASSDRYHLLEIEMETGRHHQIRSQLQVIGCPIKGDLKYGARRSNPGGGIHLHARSLQLAHPVGEAQLTIVAPPPADPVWDALVRALAERGAGGAGRSGGDPPLDLRS
jgi:23S rRNA pseudouridine1911/1915/1917 synthase